MTKKAFEGSITFFAVAANVAVELRNTVPVTEEMMEVDWYGPLKNDDSNLSLELQAHLDAAQNHQATQSLLDEKPCHLNPD